MISMWVRIFSTIIKYNMHRCTLFHVLFFTKKHSRKHSKKHSKFIQNMGKIHSNLFSEASIYWRESHLYLHKSITDKSKLLQDMRVISSINYLLTCKCGRYNFYCQSLQSNILLQGKSYDLILENVTLFHVQS